MKPREKYIHSRIPDEIHLKIEQYVREGRIESKSELILHLLESHFKHADQEPTISELQRRITGLDEEISALQRERSVIMGQLHRIQEKAQQRRLQDADDDLQQAKATVESIRRSGIMQEIDI